MATDTALTRRSVHRKPQSVPEDAIGSAERPKILAGVDVAHLERPGVTPTAVFIGQ